MTPETPRSSAAQRRTFIGLVIAVVLGNYLATRWYVAQISSQVPEWPIGFDLLILIPSAYLLIFRPPLKRALIAVIALLSLGIFVGSMLIPEDSKLVWHQLAQIRWGYLLLLICAQVATIAVVLVDIARSWRDGNLEQSLHDAIERRIGTGQVAELLKADGRVWLYLINRDDTRLKFEGVPFFGRNVDQNASNQQAFLILMAIEIPIAHLVIHLFSPTVALVATSLGLYGLLFLYAEYRATLMRPTTLTADNLHIRQGVLGDLILDYSDIEDVQETRDRPRRAKGRLRFVGMGSANTLLLLKPGALITTLLGPQHICEIYVGLDDAAAFRQQLRSAIAHCRLCDARADSPPGA